MNEFKLSFVDAHLHLTDSAYANKVDYLLQIARRENVNYLVTNSMDLESSSASIALAANNPIVYAAVGIHPWNALSLKENDVECINRLVHEKGNLVLAIGEIGLDKSYTRNANSLDIQRQLFERQLDLAEEMDLPVIVHSRDASRDIIEILESHNQKRVILHWYTGPTEYIKEICDKGWMLSVGPSILYSRRVREIVAIIPMSSLLTETDGPVAYRGPLLGRDTTPEFIRIVVNEVARISNNTFYEVANQILENFNRFFRVA